MKNLLLILTLLIISCSESEPETFMEYSDINKHLLCETKNQEEPYFYSSYAFKTNYLEDRTEKVIEVKFLHLDEIHGLNETERLGQHPFTQVDNLVEFSYPYTHRYTDEENFEIKRDMYRILVVINMKNLKGKETTSYYNDVGMSKSFNVEIECKKTININ